MAIIVGVMQKLNNNLLCITLIVRPSSKNHSFFVSSEKPYSNE